jgi:ABC-type Fe3+-siderophore transport system permease subunit
VVTAGGNTAASAAIASPTLLGVEVAAALGIVACLVALLAWTSWRRGGPRLYLRGVAALWVAAVILAAVLLRVALGLSKAVLRA